MEESESVLGYVLSGFIFYIFGLKWCYEYARYWLPYRKPSEIDAPTTSKFVRFTRSIKKLLRRHPVEGTLKLLATSFGLASTLLTAGINGTPFSGLETMTTTAMVSPKDVHATIYLFFALSGLVDVLNFYFPNVVGDGLSKMALAQSFFVEGFLFLWGNAWNDDFVVSVILTSIVWTISFAVTLELVWPEMKMLRASSSLLHATWLAHMVRTQKIHSIADAITSTERIVLIFSWHFAAAFIVTLVVVSVTRSCAPKLQHSQPPEIPIYDYCHEMSPVDQRV